MTNAVPVTLSVVPRRTPRRIVRSAAMTALALLVVAGALPAAAAAGWTEPARVTGTAGVVNPVSVTAPDGTDVVLWVDATGVPLENELHARVRVPGSNRWRSVAATLTGPFLNIGSIVPTPGGDALLAYAVGDYGATRTMLTTLDTRTRRWSRPTRVFRDADYEFTTPLVALGGDGTVLVGATARLLAPPPGDPVYRAAVAVRRPGSGWARSYLSGAGGFAVTQSVAANAHGDLAVGYKVGYSVPEMTIHGAVLRRGVTGPWRKAALSVAGDGQRTSVAIGDGGTAAFAWTGSASTFRTVRLVTTRADRRRAPWFAHEVEDSPSTATDPLVAVGARDVVTVVWRRDGTIRSRSLAGTSLRPVVPSISPDGKTGVPDVLRTRPNGSIGLLYQVFGPGIVNEGLRYRVFTRGTPGAAATITTDTDGDANGASLWFDADGRPTVVYQRGIYPATDFAWLEKR